MIKKYIRYFIKEPLFIKYCVLLLVVFSMISTESYYWLKFVKDGNMNHFYISIFSKLLIRFIKFKAFKYKRNIMNTFYGYILNEYGKEFSTFRPEAKLSKDGLLWETRCEKMTSSNINFINSISFNMISVFGSFTDIVMLYYLSPSILMLIIFIQFTFNYFYVRNFTKKMEKLSKLTRDEKNTINYTIRGLFSIFGLYGSDDNLLMNNIISNKLELKTTWEKVNYGYEVNFLIIGIVNILPMFIYVVTNTSDITTLMLVISKIKSVERLFNTFERYREDFNNIKNNSKDILEFHEKNKNNTNTLCEQLTVPDQLLFSIDYTLRDENREFHLYTTDQIQFKNNDKILITGESGSGKSTLNKIICGHYNYGGDVVDYENGFHSFFNSVCEISAGNCKGIDYTQSIGQILSILDSSDEEIIHILEIVCLYDWVEELGGIHVPLNNNLSEGQKLRLSLSLLLIRAKVRNSDIIVLDEIDQNLQEYMAKNIIINIFNEFSDKLILLVVHTERLKEDLQFTSIININKGEINIQYL